MNTKFFPFFQNALGALDGTHINCSATATDWHASDDCKGGLTQNCLAVCGFEGSAADATMYMHPRLMDFVIPQGKYYLADAGFALCDTLLVPYQGVCYHLAEWGSAEAR